MQAFQKFAQISALVALLASGAAANADLRAEFKRSAETIPLRLIEMRQPAPGGFDAQAAIDFIDHDVTVVPVDRVAVSVPMSDEVVMERNFAEWLMTASGWTVRLSKSMWPKTTDEAKEVVTLHEICGPLHCHDDHFFPTVGLWLLSLPETRSILRPDEIKGIEDRIRVELEIGAREAKPKPVAGGVVGIGGGGDPFGATSKMRMSYLSLLRIQQSSPDERANAVQGLYGSFYTKTEILRGAVLSPRYCPGTREVCGYAPKRLR